MPRTKRGKTSPKKTRGATVPRSSDVTPSIIAQSVTQPQSGGKKSLQNGGFTWQDARALAQLAAGAADRAHGHNRHSKMVADPVGTMKKLFLKPSAKEGYKRIGALTAGGAPPPPPPGTPSPGAVVADKKYDVGASLRPSHHVNESRAVMMSSARGGEGGMGGGVGAAYPSETPSVGYTLSAIHDGLVFEGTDYISPVQYTDAASAAGTLIKTLYLNPHTIGLQRLASFASLYERFEFEHFEVIYCQATASSTTGGMLMYFERDPDDSLPPGSEARLKSAFGHAGVVTTNYWNNCVCRLPPNKGEYFVDAGTENRLTTQGIFRALVEVKSNATANPGVFMARYKVRLWQSKLDGDTPGASAYAASRTVASCTAANPLGTSGTASGQAHFTNHYISYGTTDSILGVLAGYHAFWWQVDLQGAAVTTLTIGGGSGNSNCAVYAGDAGGSYWDTNITSATRIVRGGLWTISDPSNAAYVTLRLATFTTPSYVGVQLYPFNYTAPMGRLGELREQLRATLRRVRDLDQRLTIMEDSDSKDASPEATIEDIKTNAGSLPESPRRPPSLVGEEPNDWKLVRPDSAPRSIRPPSSRPQSWK